MTTPIFDQARTAWPARDKDPSTSHDAVPDKPTVALVQARVLSILDAHGPCTHDEIRDWYLLAHGYGRGSSPASIRTRTSELHELGGVRAVDRNGVTPSGRSATRWDVHR